VDGSDKLTTVQRIALQVLAHCEHFFSIHAMDELSDVMDSAQLCVHILRTNKRQLLPAVFRLWDPLVARFRSREVLFADFRAPAPRSSIAEAHQGERTDREKLILLKGMYLSRSACEERERSVRERERESKQRGDGSTHI
jgi:hypothetical protein